MRRRRWRRSGLLAAFAFAVLVLSPATSGIAPARAEDFEERAKEVAAEKTGISRNRLKIAQSSEAGYPNIGLKARAVKVIDEQTGRIEGVLLDGNGQALDARAVEQAEQQARSQKYGRLAPALTQKIQAADANARTGVNIWLKDTSQRQASRPDPNRRAGAASVSAATVQTAQQQAQVQRQADVSALSTPVVQRLAGLGIKAQTSGLAPNIVAALTRAEMQVVGSWPEVDTIYPVYGGKPDLASMRATVGANVVNNDRNITGTGVRVAALEADGRAAHANPWLSPYTQDQTYVCEFAENHATGVAGIIRSSHSTNRGMAPGAMLWVGGACSETDTDEEFDAHMQDRSRAAVDWGALALNLSWTSGLEILPAPGAMDRFYDDIFSSYWRLVVKSAGNEGDGTTYVTNPGLGFNVLAVGNFDDRGSGGRLDDVMNPTSSWQDPVSTNGDRGKPEVAAPGTDVNSLLFATPGVGNIGSGTSYAAPVVTGMAALLIQRDAALAVWPQITKAIIMATALHNIEGAAMFSEYDGAGGVDFAVADDVVTRTSGNWGGQAYNCSTPTPLALDTIQLAAGQRARAVIVWDQNTAYTDYVARPSADLDLLINGPNGLLVVGSATYDNTYEIVDFTAPTTGTYALRVSRFRCDLTPRWLGWAWWRGVAPPPTRRLTVTNTNPAGGLIGSLPVGIECGPTCASNFTENSSVALIPIPSSGRQFSGWSGACTNVVVPCDVTMSADRTVTGGFVAVTCSPRPRVSINTLRLSNGSLQATIAVGTGGGVFQKIQFGDTTQRPSVPTNASISVTSPPNGPSNQTASFTYNPPANTTSVTLAVARGASATTVPIVVTDGCGEWHSMFGTGS